MCQATHATEAECANCGDALTPADAGRGTGYCPACEAEFCFDCPACGNRLDLSERAESGRCIECDEGRKDAAREVMEDLLDAGRADDVLAALRALAKAK